MIASAEKPQKHLCTRVDHQQLKYSKEWPTLQGYKGYRGDRALSLSMHLCLQRKWLSLSASSVRRFIPYDKRRGASLCVLVLYSQTALMRLGAVHPLPNWRKKIHCVQNMTPFESHREKKKKRESVRKSEKWGAWSETEEETEHEEDEIKRHALYAGLLLISAPSSWSQQYRVIQSTIKGGKLKKNYGIGSIFTSIQGRLLF